MAELKIFSNVPLPEKAMQLLRAGIAPHKLILQQGEAVSVLSPTAPDPGLRAADIAFGQLEVRSILESKSIRWVHVTSAGYTRYDTPEFRAAAKARGLVLTNSSTVYAEACAEHVFAFMLAQARQLPDALGTQCPSSSPEWGQLRSATSCLRGQSAVILGFGAIANRLAAMLAPFDMKIVAMRRHPQGDEGVPVVTPEKLKAALAEADHVINILPDNAASRGFISTEKLEWMKRGAIFYNIGRGTTVDQRALVASLKSGHLGAAWLDVTDPEPLPEDHPLLTAPNCFITPHIAGGQHDEAEALVRHFLENFALFLKSEPLRDRVI